ncbi:hypothetical protein LY78DRAFT_677906 [Colletotrichum sublineola]|uniref:Uncharacterized protein n=1 Tax=Colletotrichum sublineola TaxID=1173701 RepID=A0A066X943_COLSU|nr:hypothetical protein LY78DRAFT_677906 [Colletotrichum sublineola]KDN62550.1 hypothetical protein CSUB01_02267 [Colletotrichum sublineola]
MRVLPTCTKLGTKENTNNNANRAQRFADKDTATGMPKVQVRWIAFASKFLQHADSYGLDVAKHNAIILSNLQMKATANTLAPTNQMAYRNVNKALSTANGQALYADAWTVVLCVMGNTTKMFTKHNGRENHRRDGSDGCCHQRGPLVTKLGSQLHLCGGYSVPSS